MEDDDNDVSINYILSHLDRCHPAQTSIETVPVPVVLKYHGPFSDHPQAGAHVVFTHFHSNVNHYFVLNQSSVEEHKDSSGISFGHSATASFERLQD